MSKRTSGNNIHGILLLDKRIGVSSNKVLQEIRRLFNANKAGHTGSLDPLATGLLPLCFGEATKVCAFLLDENKRYRVVGQLGVITDSGDAEGKVIATNPVPEISIDELKQCLAQFQGNIQQIPPMYSALKHQGQKLYELARRGETIEREARAISIFELKLINFASPYFTLDVFCSKGTYIRSLIEDIGQNLNCGATVTALRRLQVGQFDIQQAFTLEQLTAFDSPTLQKCLMPVDKPLEFMPSVQLSLEQTKLIQFGQAIATEQTTLGMVRMYQENLFLGLGEILADGKLAPKKLFNLTDSP